jgi:hypothetical protein
MNENQNILQQKEEAREISRTMGNLSGRYGEVVCRIYRQKKKDGRVVYQQRFATLPADYRVNNRKDMVENRSRFRVNNTFSGFINRIPELKEIWKVYASKKGHVSAYTAITKVNSAYTTHNGPCEKNMIVPPVKSVEFDRGNISVSENSLAITGLRGGSFLGVVVLADPKSLRNEKFKLFLLRGEVGRDGLLKIAFTREVEEGLQGYKRYILYFTVISEGKYVNYAAVKGRMKRGEAGIKEFLQVPVNDTLIIIPLFIENKDSHSHSPPLAA